MLLSKIHKEPVSSDIYPSPRVFSTEGNKEGLATLPLIVTLVPLSPGSPLGPAILVQL